MCKSSSQARMASLDPLRRQGGQALVEYILVLVVVISLILGLAYKFNSAFRVYLDNYFGNYLACLLETGELPRIGGVGDGGICETEFQAFDPAKGKDSNLQSGGSAGTNAGTAAGNSGQTVSRKGSSPSESDANEGADATEETSPNRADTGGGGGGGGGGGRGRGISSFLNRRGRPKSVVVGQVASNEDGESKIMGVRKSRVVGQLDRSVEVKKKTFDRSYLTSGDDDEGEQKSLTQKSNMNESSGNSLRPKRMTFTSKTDTGPATEEEDEEFSIGMLLRYILIIAIIIILVVFIGGQVLQISKSWEK